MIQKFKLLLAILVIIFISSCAGKNFIRPEPNSLVLGKTTYQEIINRFGKPYQEGSELKNEQIVKSIFYAYSSVGGTPLFEEVTPARGMGFYFSNDILVGYHFQSSFKEDHSNFDETRISQIKKGKTSRSQVIELIGKPTGKYIYPLIKIKGDEAIVYTYSHVKHFKLYQKILVISFDNNGTVRDIEFTSSGKK